MSGITFAGISVKTSAKAVSIPEYATGGIVTREHIARVGEDGAEAIIPLEHNTEWIDRVASRMSGSTSNTEVVSKLDEVIALLKNQKIYLDSGQLVGGIADKMDRKLGSVARLKGRA
jgi:SLT domain-containing protein